MNRDWPPDTPADPSAGSGVGQPCCAQAHRSRTGQSPQRGDRRVHTVAPRSSMAWFHAQACAGRDGASASGLGGRRGEAVALPARQDAGRVGVHHAVVVLEGEGQHRPGRVGTDTGEGEQAGEIRRQPAVVPLHHLRRRSVQVTGAAVVAKPAPPADGLGDGGCRHRRRGGEALEEGAPALGHPGHLRLLAHHLAHEDLPRVARRPPGEVALAKRPPAQERTAHHWTRHTYGSGNGSGSRETSAVTSVARRSRSVEGITAM